MSRKRISQRDAQKMRKRVNELEQAEYKRRSAWSQEYLGGVNITSIRYESGEHAVPVAIRTARKLNHAVVAIGDDAGGVRFIALPHPEVKL